MAADTPTIPAPATIAVFTELPLINELVFTNRLTKFQSITLN